MDTKKRKVPANFHGKKGRSGRKSAYQEHLDAQQHYQAWTLPQDVEELEKRIKSKKYSVWDVFLLKALKADPRILAKYSDKVMPDLTVLMGPTGGAIAVDLKGEAKKRSAKYHRKSAA